MTLSAVGWSVGLTSSVVGQPILEEIPQQTALVSAVSPVFLPPSRAVDKRVWYLCCQLRV